MKQLLFPMKVETRNEEKERENKEGGIERRQE
jgi:hypothetical protein